MKKILVVILIVLPMLLCGAGYTAMNNEITMTTRVVVCTDIPNTIIPNTIEPDTPIPDTPIPDTPVPDTAIPDTPVPTTVLDTPAPAETVIPSPPAKKTKAMPPKSVKVHTLPPPEDDQQQFAPVTGEDLSSSVDIGLLAAICTVILVGLLWMVLHYVFK